VDDLEEPEDLTPPPRRPLLRDRRLWLIAPLPPLAAAVASWFLAGSEAWVWVSLGGMCLLGLVGLGMLRAVVVAGDAGFVRGLALFGYLLLVGAAWAVVGHSFPPTTVTIKPDERTPVVPVRYVYKGELLGESERPFEYVLAFRGRFDRASLRVEASGPDGWVRLPFTSYGHTGRVTATLESIPTVELYVDNRNNGAARLECGEMVLDVPAGATQRRVVPVPSHAVAVRLGGLEIGTLKDEHLLIDVLGTREYVLREKQYRDAFGMLLQGAEPKVPLVRRIGGGRLHRLPRRLDYFLEAAPDKVTVKTYGFALGAQAERYELLDAD
jgi:hypothetical protein